MLRGLTAVAVATITAGCTVVGIRSGTEQVGYQVVERLAEDVEVRRYPARLAAETVVARSANSDGRNAAFRILADYIFGNNRQSEKIAMTAPVEVQAGQKIAMTIPVEVAPDASDRMRMRFFMPAEYTRETLPTPTDPRVTILELAPQTAAVRMFSGDRDREELAAQEQALLAVLAGTRWQPAGDPTAYFYDPPWTLPFLRRNEVAVPVTEPAE